MRSLESADSALSIFYGRAVEVQDLMINQEIV